MIKLYRADTTVPGSELIAKAALEICNEADAKVIRSENGKPYFANLDIKFSLSHSGERMILAVSEKEIGADIQIKKDVSLRLAERFFTDNEQKYIFGGKSSREIKDRFYEIWTKKEAYGKWKGCGLSGVLDEDVTALDFYTEDDGEYSLAIYEE